MDPLFRRLATNTTLFMQSCLLTGDVVCVGQPNAMGTPSCSLAPLEGRQRRAPAGGEGSCCPCVSPGECLANSP